MSLISNLELNQRQDLLLNTVFMFNGLKRAGKDTIARLLQEVLKEDFDLDFQILAFAKPMKNIISKSLGVTLEELENLKNAEDIMYFHNKERDFRKLIEDFGQAVKEEMGQDIWARITWGKIEESIEAQGLGCIISDFRFPIEYPSYSDYNIVTIKVENANVSCSGSLAETSLDDFHLDYYIQNDIKWGNDAEEMEIVEDLKEQLRFIISDYFYERGIE